MWLDQNIKKHVFVVENTYKELNDSSQAIHHDLIFIMHFILSKRMSDTSDTNPQSIEK